MYPGEAWYYIVRLGSILPLTRHKRTKIQKKNKPELNTSISVLSPLFHFRTEHAITNNQLRLLGSPDLKRACMAWPVIHSQRFYI